MGRADSDACAIPPDECESALEATPASNATEAGPLADPGPLRRELRRFPSDYGMYGLMFVSARETYSSFSPTGAT